MQRTCLFVSLALIVCLLSGGPAPAIDGPAWQGLSPPLGTSADVHTTAGLFVNTRSGNLHLRRRVLRLPGRGMPLDLLLIYNGDRHMVTSPCGRGWNHSLNVRYTRDVAGNATIAWGDGRQDTFTVGPAGGFTPPAGVWFDLTQVGDVLTLTSKFGQAFVFADPVGRKLTSLEDPNGNAIRLSYDGNSRLDQAVDTAGRNVDFAYDARGRLTSVTDSSTPTARTIQLGYDGDDHLTSLQDARGEIELYAYDFEHLLELIIDRRGNAATIVYATPAWDAATRLVQEVAKDASVDQFVYDDTLRTTTHLDPNANTTSYVYDGTGRLVTVTDADLNASRLSWDVDGNITAIQDRRNGTRRFVYDLRGNLVSATDALGNERQWTYDPTFSRATSLTNARNHTWTNTYDPRGNLIQVTDPLSNVTALTVDAVGQVTAIQDPAGGVRIYEWDAAGNLAAFTDESSSRLEYAYDGAGRVVQWTDQRGKVWGRALDIRDNLISRTNPLGRTWRYSYDEAGNLVQHTDGKGQVTTNEYDALNRLVGMSFADATAAGFTYDSAGNVLSAQDASSSYTFTYDALNRQIAYTDELLSASVQYEYDAESHITKKTSPGPMVVSYEYDAAGRRTRVIDPGGISTFRFDAEGNAVRNARPNGIASNYAYDRLGRLSSILHEDPADNPLQSFAYTRDALGRVTQTLRETGEIVTFTYDPAGRVLAETGGLGLVGHSLTSTYDAAGNLTRTQGAFPGFPWDTSFTHDDAGRTVTEDNMSFQYDANGARTKHVVDQTTENVYGYDARNRLVSYLPSWAAQPKRYTYDVFDRLVGVTEIFGTVRRYMYGSPEPVAVFDGAGDVTYGVPNVCIYGVLDFGTGDLLYTHPGGNRPYSPVFFDLPNTLATNGAGQVAASWTYHSDGGLRSDDMVVSATGVPNFLFDWMNANGGFHDGTTGASIKDGLAWDDWHRQPLNCGVRQGNSVPGYTSAATVRWTDAASGDAQIAPYMADFDAINGYTFIAVTNTSASNNTITLTFNGADGVAVASSSSTLAPGASWTLSTAGGDGSHIAGPGDFEGTGALGGTSAAGPAVAGSFGVLQFADGFESGNTLAWSQEVGR